MHLNVWGFNILKISSLMQCSFSLRDGRDKFVYRRDKTHDDKEISGVPMPYFPFRCQAFGCRRDEKHLDKEISGVPLAYFPPRSQVFTFCSQ